MIGIEIKPVFHIDADGNIVAPSGNVIVDKTQLVAPGVFYANVELLNTVYHYGMQAAVTGNLVERANDRSRTEAMRQWLETDESLPDPIDISDYMPEQRAQDRKLGAAIAATYYCEEHKPKPDVGPQCEAKGQCECTDGCGACHGCGRWLGDEPERIKKER